MRFVFSRRFFVLLAFGIVPLSLSWTLPELRYVVLVYDVVLIAAAFVDFLISRKLPEEFTITREFEKRFAIGDANKVSLKIENSSSRAIHLIVKDEYPPEMKLNETREEEFTADAQTSAEFFYHLTPPKRGRYQFGKTAVRYRSRLGLVWCQADLGQPQAAKVYPNMRRAREMELRALGAR